MIVMYGNRTDLASEELPQGGGELPGVKSRTYDRDGFSITEVEVLDEQGASKLCKPIGTYITVDTDRFFRREENAFEMVTGILADLIRRLMHLNAGDSVLVAGLGNRAITPDSVGPEAVACTLVTRHLKEQMPEDFSAFRPICAFEAGVMGTTGLESADLIRSLCATAQPKAVVAVDALASRSSDKLCRTVQLADSGIVPGSGVGNSRSELSRRVLGVPVLAIGVPTVVDAGEGLITTPRDIDKNVKDVGRVIGYGLNLAFHDGLKLSDIDMFLG